MKPSPPSVRRAIATFVPCGHCYANVPLLSAGAPRPMERNATTFVVETRRATCERCGAAVTAVVRTRPPGVDRRSLKRAGGRGV